MRCLLVFLFVLGCVGGQAFAQNLQPQAVTLAGTMQMHLGCPGNWQPECTLTNLHQTGNEWSATFLIPAGTWEYKIALNNTWEESYGYNRGSANAQFTLAEEKAVTFRYQQDTQLVTDDASDASGGPDIPQPDVVTIAGDLQTALGCSGNWQSDCEASRLTYDEHQGIWWADFDLPAGDWEFKAALNDSWEENYGRNAVAGGDNIRFSLAEARQVRFYYSHASHWVTNNVISRIATAVGNFQQHLGCQEDWQPGCLRGWLQDIEGTGLYTFSTTAIPPGNYEAKVALDLSWDESYGNQGMNIPFVVAEAGQRVHFTFDAIRQQVFVGEPVNTGNLAKARAHWLDRHTVVWGLPAASIANASVRLHYSPDAQLTSGPAGVDGGESLALTHDAAGLSAALKQRFPHLAHLPVFTLSETDPVRLREILKSQMAVSATNADGNLLDATGVQFAGVLDDLFFYGDDLGVTFADGVPTLRVWAPTARSVHLHLYDDSHPATPGQVLPMTEDPATGVWSITGDAGWNRKFYRYEADVFARHTGQRERNLVTDPYSLSASTDGKRSQIVNLADADLLPEAWHSFSKPPLEAPEDIIIYELHLRDFSIHDTSVPEAVRGTFLAFAQPESRGIDHLRKLTEAGLTHVHFLPVFDCATIPEDRADQLQLTQDLSSYPPDSEEQQAAVNAIRGSDGFNWCYDPHHYTLPEGSYATDPDGVTRIREFRQMVQSLNQLGLRVVMDVVYNHTSGSRQGDKSVLDKIVPDYYHRLNADGDIENSTCCANTATEHRMMEKLMLDSLRTWAVDYKVDGFRFDLMGHHSKENILKVQALMASLTPAADGVDGSKIYLYGEGWNFGEVVNNARFEQASIDNMAGTGVGTFNNRIRDAVRGGGPFDVGVDHVRSQSFINGLYLDPNAENHGSDDERQALLRNMDHLRATLAGSLAEYRFENRQGETITTAQLDYDGQQAGYTADPQETINYIEAHDNETLFDSNQYKLPLATTPAERVRVHNLGASLMMFSQGIPFVHAGQELLRSKSMDRNTYDAGDWFNLLDYSYQDNGWGRGLPLAQENQQNWPVIQPRLADPALAVDAGHIEQSLAHMLEIMRMRSASRLFRLENAGQVQQVLRFHNTGPQQIPGLIVMSLTDTDANLDPLYEDILVLFNADVQEHSITLANRADKDFILHPVLQDSADARVKTAGYDGAAGRFTVPARTTAVFVSTRQPGAELPPPVNPPQEPPPASGGKKSGSAAGLLWILGMLLLLAWQRGYDRILTPVSDSDEARHDPSAARHTL